MRNRMRHLACLFVASACVGASWGQSQTNITVQGEGQPQAQTKDTVKVVPEGTRVVPNGNGGSTAISDEAYTPPDTAREVGAIPAEQTKILQNRREAKRFSAAGFGPAGFGNVDERMPA